jgi:16S rRNA (guanine1516-N2)-methyltransferase
MLNLYVTDKTLQSQAIDLITITPSAQIVYEKPKDNNLYLQLDQSGLALSCPEFNLTYISDLYTKLKYRLKQLNQELLIQAVKVKTLNRLNIWDITGGLGRDALLLANAGHQVTLVERNPALALILNYLIKNQIMPGTENLHLVHMESLEYLRQKHAVLPHVIYFDPMFQDNMKAKAKKEMQIIEMLLSSAFAHDLVGDGAIEWKNPPDHITGNNENRVLFDLAYATVLNKVVVKRDNKQQPISNIPNPSYNKCGKTIRYDVYLQMN